MRRYYTYTRWQKRFVALSGRGYHQYAMNEV